MEPFDIAAVTPNCDRRSASTVAPQALLMMNNEIVVRFAERFAQRVIAEAGDDPAAQVRRAWLLAFGRDAGEPTTAEAVAFLNAPRQHFTLPIEAASAQPAAKPATPPTLTPNQQALALLCQALMSSNQFL